MRNDPIVDEIRKIRKEHSDQFGSDLHAICEDLRRQELESTREYVTYPPRRVSSSVAAEATNDKTEASDR